jgi:peptide/nickel transport system substrate-binding protein
MKTTKILIAILFIAAQLLAACTQQSATPAAETEAAAAEAQTEGSPAEESTGPQVGGEFVWALQQEPDSLDWAKTALISSYTVDYYVSAALLALTPEQTLVPWLAESYQVSDDGLTYEFTLRDDIRFHDGTPLTAADYVWTFNRALDPDTASPAMADQLGPVASITEIDQYSFRIILESAYAPLLFNLADPGFMGPMSEAAFNAMGADAYGRAPVGVGPFKVVEWRTGEAITLERNPDYVWGPEFAQGPAYIETLEFRIIPEYSTIVAGLQAGEIHFSQLQIKDVESFRALDSFVLFSQQAKGIRPALFLNVSTPPFDDLNVRLAFNYAINRQGLIDVVLLGNGDIQYGPLSPLQIGYWDGAGEVGYGYDAETARQYFEAAGYALNADNLLEKDGQPFTLGAMVFSGNEINTRTIQIIQQQLLEVGVTVNIEEVEPGVAFDRLIGGDYQLAILGVTSQEADILYSLFHSSGSLNLGHIADPELDALLEQSRTTVDPEARQQVLDDIQRMIIEKAYIVPLFIPQYYYALDSRLQGSSFLFFDVLDLVNAYFR